MCDLLHHVSCVVSACVDDGLGRGSICFDVKLILMLHVGLSDRVGSSLGFLPTSSQCSGVMLSWVFALVSATKFCCDACAHNASPWQRSPRGFVAVSFEDVAFEILVGKSSHVWYNLHPNKSVIKYCHDRLKFG